MQSKRCDFPTWRPNGGRSRWGTSGPLPPPPGDPYLLLQLAELGGQAVDANPGLLKLLVSRSCHAAVPLSRLLGVFQLQRLEIAFWRWPGLAYFKVAGPQGCPGLLCRAGVGCEPPSRQLPLPRQEPDLARARSCPSAHRPLKLQVRETRWDYLTLRTSQGGGRAAEQPLTNVCQLGDDGSGSALPWPCRSSSAPPCRD